MRCLHVIYALAVIYACSVTRCESAQNRRTIGVTKVEEFIQLTDMHFDPFYKTGGSVKFGCHVVPTTRAGRTDNGDDQLTGDAFGVRGDRCDTPAMLLNATLDFIREKRVQSVETRAKAGKIFVQASPLYVLWTGDTVRHDNDPRRPVTEQRVFDQLRGMMDLLLGVLRPAPSSSTAAAAAPLVGPVLAGAPASAAQVPSDSDAALLIPTLGVHDVVPAGVLPPGPNPFLAKVHELWAPILPDNNENKETFLVGGYHYRHVRKRLIVASLNTLYFLEQNTAAGNCTDKESPGAVQFEWLQRVLQRAQTLNKYVYVMGHVPPGSLYKDDCLFIYRTLAERFDSAIKGHFFGHAHIDEFNLLYGTRNSTRPAGVVFVAPSLVPQYNPAIRTFQYDPSDGSLLGYTQYFMDLDKANDAAAAAAGEVRHKKGSKRTAGMVPSSSASSSTAAAVTAPPAASTDPLAAIADGLDAIITPGAIPPASEQRDAVTANSPSAPTPAAAAAAASNAGAGNAGGASAPPEQSEADWESEFVPNNPTPEEREEYERRHPHGPLQIPVPSEALMQQEAAKPPPRLYDNARGFLNDAAARNVTGSRTPQEAAADTARVTQVLKDEETRSLDAFAKAFNSIMRVMDNVSSAANATRGARPPAWAAAGFNGSWPASAGADGSHLPVNSSLAPRLPVHDPYADKRYHFNTSEFPQFVKEYNTREAYGLTELSVESMYDLYIRKKEVQERRDDDEILGVKHADTGPSTSASTAVVDGSHRSASDIFDLYNQFRFVSTAPVAVKVYQAPSPPPKPPAPAAAPPVYTKPPMPPFRPPVGPPSAATALHRFHFDPMHHDPFDHAFGDPSKTVLPEAPTVVAGEGGREVVVGYAAPAPPTRTSVAKDAFGFPLPPPSAPISGPSPAEAANTPLPDVSQGEAEEHADLQFSANPMYDHVKHAPTAEYLEPVSSGPSAARSADAHVLGKAGMSPFVKQVATL